MLNEYVAWKWVDNVRHYYTGNDQWHPDVAKAVVLTYDEARSLGPDHDFTCKALAPQGCKKCGNREVVRTRHGDICCGGCDIGVHAVHSRGRRTMSLRNQCWSDLRRVGVGGLGQKFFKRTGCPIEIADRRFAVYMV